MSTYNISPALNKNKVFILQKSELDKRLDPSWYVYLKSIKDFKHKKIALKKLLLENPQYGANEIGIERTDNSEPRYIRITDINEFGELVNELGKTASIIEEKYFLKENDLLLARSGNTVGKSYLHKDVGYDCFFAGYMIRFIINTATVLPEYVFAYTQTDFYKKWTKAIQRTTGQPNINAEEYKNLEIPLPNISTQEKIIKVYFDFLAQKKQNEDEAEKLLASIDDYLLKELGITLPAPNENTLKDRMFTVSIRKISGNRFDSPFYQFNWNLMSNKFPMANLADVVLINPPTYFENIMNEEEISFVPMESVSNEGFISVYQKDKIVNSKGYTFFKEGDLLVAKITPCMENGKTAIAKYLHNGFGFGSTEFHVFRKIHNQIEIDFLHFLFRTKYFRSISKQQYGGSAGHQRVPPVFFQKLQIPLPPLDKQKEIADHITDIRQQAQQLKEKMKEALSNASQEIEKILLT